MALKQTFVVLLVVAAATSAASARSLHGLLGAFVVAEEASTSEGQSCFPASASVQTPDGPKAMSDVVPFDRVLTVNDAGQVQYSSVFLLSSRRPEKRSKFLRISTASGANVTLTRGHFVPVVVVHDGGGGDDDGGKKKYLAAGELAVGDLVMTATTTVTTTAIPTAIIAIDEVDDVGLFNPHPVSGAIVVDGVVTSDVTAAVPRWMASDGRFAKMAGAYFAVAPRWVDRRLAETLAGWMHEGSRDAIISRDAFMAD